MNTSFFALPHTVFRGFMKKRCLSPISVIRIFVCLTISLFFANVHLTAQTAIQLKQQSLSKWNIGAAHYSGITALGDNLYALVSDKEPSDGFFIFRIEQNKLTGQVKNVALEGFKGSKSSKVDAKGVCIRDCEGVAFFPPSKSVFISGEGDQRVVEYSIETGQPTGRELNVPKEFSSCNIFPNYGFEALCYDQKNELFWTTSESTLRSDGFAVSASHPLQTNVLRLQSFDNDLQPVAQYAYRMDSRQTQSFGKLYFNGVTSLCALPDGRLLVLEREANITPVGLGSKVWCKLFIIYPANSQPISHSVSSNLDSQHTVFLEKKLLTQWQTTTNPFKLNFANYEGMCLGQKLFDGRQTLLLVSDSQAGYRKGPFRLKDYIKVIVIGY